MMDCYGDASARSTASIMVDRSAPWPSYPALSLPGDVTVPGQWRSCRTGRQPELVPGRSIGADAYRNRLRSPEQALDQFLELSKQVLHGNTPGYGLDRPIQRVGMLAETRHRAVRVNKLILPASDDFITPLRVMPPEPTQGPCQPSFQEAAPVIPNLRRTCSCSASAHGSRMRLPDDTSRM